VIPIPGGCVVVPWSEVTALAQFIQALGESLGNVDDDVLSQPLEQYVEDCWENLGPKECENENE